METRNICNERKTVTNMGDASLTLFKNQFKWDCLNTTIKREIVRVDRK